MAEKTEQIENDYTKETFKDRTMSTRMVKEFEGKLYEVGAIASVARGDVALDSGGSVLKVVQYSAQVGLPRHICTPIPDNDRRVVKAKLGQLYELLELDQYKDTHEILGVMRKCDRPEDTGCIDMESGAVYNERYGRQSAYTCIALRPIPEPKTPEEELAEQLANMTDEELTQAVAVDVMGWELLEVGVGCSYWVDGSIVKDRADSDYPHSFNPPTNANDRDMVVETMVEKFHKHLVVTPCTNNGELKYICSDRHQELERWWEGLSGRQDTPGRAVCIAALKAVESEQTA